MFAGTSVGSVLLWDLREYASDHDRLTLEDEEWTLRQPTFSTGTFILLFNTFDRPHAVPYDVLANFADVNPCRRRCGYGQLGSFLACDVHRSRALRCSRRAEVGGPSFGISGR